MCTAAPVALAVLLMIVSHRVRSESLREIGFRFDNLLRALYLLAVPVVMVGGVCLLIARLTGSDRLYFYDSISPIVDAETIDYSIAFRASRYGKSIDSSDDYVNCPLDREQYERFVDALLAAQSYDPHIPEDATPFFEACLPVEELARRGRETLRFGPMKPMGLDDPRTKIKDCELCGPSVFSSGYGEFAPEAYAFPREDQTPTTYVGGEAACSCKTETCATPEIDAKCDSRCVPREARCSESSRRTRSRSGPAMVRPW